MTLDDWLNKLQVTEELKPQALTPMNILKALDDYPANQGYPIPQWNVKADVAQREPKTNLPKTIQALFWTDQGDMFTVVVRKAELANRWVASVASQTRAELQPDKHEPDTLEEIWKFLDNRIKYYLVYHVGKPEPRAPTAKHLPEPRALKAKPLGEVLAKIQSRIDEITRISKKPMDDLTMQRLNTLSEAQEELRDGASKRSFQDRLRSLELKEVTPMRLVTREELGFVLSVIQLTEFIDNHVGIPSQAQATPAIAEATKIATTFLDSRTYTEQVTSGIESVVKGKSLYRDVAEVEDDLRHYLDLLKTTQDFMARQATLRSIASAIGNLEGFKRIAGGAEPLPLPKTQDADIARENRVKALREVIGSRGAAIIKINELLSHPDDVAYFARWRGSIRFFDEKEDSFKVSYKYGTGALGKEVTMTYRRYELPDRRYIWRRED